MKKIKDLEIYIMQNIKTHKGINATAVAEQFGIDRHTVAKHYKELTNQKSKATRKKRQCCLLNITKEFEDEILNPTIKLKATYMYMINIHSINEIGTYSNFVQYVRKHYGKERKNRRMGLAKYRFETLPGDLLEFDWIEDLKLELSNGEIIKFNLWSSTLAFSRFHFFRVAFSKTTEEFRRCLIDNIIAIGGRPLRIMTDNMTAIAKIVNGKRYIYPEVVQFLKDLNIELVLCKPRHPFTKGKVEVSNKYQSWLDPYNKKFATLDEALQLIPLIIMQCNNQPNSETNLAPIKLFNKNEKNALKDLPDPDIFKFYYGIFNKTTVNNSSLIRYRGASYSVPENYIGKEVYVTQNGSLIEIFDLNMEHIISYGFHSHGIHYLKSLYDVHRKLLSNKMTESEYFKMVEKNLDLLANLGGKF